MKVKGVKSVKLYTIERGKRWRLIAYNKFGESLKVIEVKKNE